VEWVPITGSVDISGANAATSTTFTNEKGVKATVATRRVKGTNWARVDSRPWVKFLEDPNLAVAPFAGVERPGTVAWVSSKVVKKVNQHTLLVTTGRLLDITTQPFNNVSEPALTSATWTLVVDDQGRPISGRDETTGRIRVERQLQHEVFELDATFSKVGAKITIKAP
jgi:hypothetical protein